jgi:protein-S-isoprenylcysteine O-methyltransferase Ste14
MTSFMSRFPQQDLIAFLVWAGVTLVWLWFMVIFLFRKHPSQREETQRDRKYIVGIVLQSVGFALAFSIHRRNYSPLFAMPLWLEVVLGIGTVALAAGSTWFAMSAVRTLGKQWAYAARLVKGHQLVTTGPYSRVRNPIYTGMLGMLLATSLAVGRLSAIPLVVAIFALGTWIRVKSEERLLRGAFGGQFDEYMRRVPAVLPRFLKSSRR